MDLGIIGNCQYNALIDQSGRVRWLCWPRFDSSFIFGGLLDEDHGGVFSIGLPDGQSGEQNYLVNTNVLRTVFTDDHGSFEVIDFAPRFRNAERYYKPTMMIRIIRPLSGEPMVRVKVEPRYEYGKKELKPVFGSNHVSYEGTGSEVRLTTNASLALVNEGRPFTVDRTYYFVLTFGKPLETGLTHTAEEFLDKTVRYWQTWVKHSDIPTDYQQQVIRSALVLKLHQYEDTGAIIAASTTSIPEAQGTVRNWDYRYCWLRDALFSLIALQRLTHFEEMEGFVSYLRNIAASMVETGDRLQPVYGLSGERQLTETILDHLSGYKGHQPVRVGNQAYEHLQHDVYGEMILAISQLFLDQRFIGGERSKPVGMLKTLLDRIETYLEATDAGLWEFRGIAQLHTFTVLMHWAGATMAELIGRRCGYKDLKQKAAEIREKSARIIYSRCWNEEIGAFTQAAGLPHLDASLLMLINLGFLDPKSSKTHRHLEAIATTLTTENGFIHRYKHEDDFGSTENSFTICSFWLAEAYARVGQRGKAEDLFLKLLKCSNHLGLYSEDIHPVSGELWGNFPQTYSHVGLINCAFRLSETKEISSFFEAANESI